MRWRYFLILVVGLGLAAQPALGVEPARALPSDLRGEPLVLLAKKSEYRMHLFASGKLVKTYVIGLGQQPIGHKQKQDDNRTPEGRYFIIQKALGPFPGMFRAYLGTGPVWRKVLSINCSSRKSSRRTRKAVNHPRTRPWAEASASTGGTDTGQVPTNKT